MTKVFFETEWECNRFIESQKCKTRKYYDTLTQSYYAELLNKHTLFGVIRPNLYILTDDQRIYNDYCNIVKSIENCTNYLILAEYEKKELPKLLKRFNKFRDKMRTQYD